MTRVACIAGARPNFMKIKPVVDGLEALGVKVDLVHTGQHYDAAMSDVFFEDLGLRPPDVHLDVGAGTHAETTARVMVAFESWMGTNPVDAVVVVGDVNSTIACALVAAKAGAVVAHVEAGLRSRDWDMPEEINRVATDRVSDLLLAPSPDGVENLRAEGYHDDQIHLVGNVMIDSLLANVGRASAGGHLDELGLVAPFGLVTLHRPSNVDDLVVLAGLMSALAEISVGLPLVFPVHPRTRSKLESIDLPSSIRLLPPQGYLPFLALQSSARLVLTDSGGIQEETTALGVPCLTLRENTERPITVTEGTNRVVGTDPSAIVEAAREVLADPPEPRCPALWDGRAGERIADVLVERISDGSALRPTDDR